MISSPDLFRPLFPPDQPNRRHETCAALRMPAGSDGVRIARKHLSKTVFILGVTIRGGGSGEGDTQPSALNQTGCVAHSLITYASLTDMTNGGFAGDHNRHHIAN